MAELRGFETGLIVVGTKTIEVAEISVNSTKDLNEHYTSDSKKPKYIRSTNYKYEYTIKKVFSDFALSKIFEADCEFTLLLFNNDVDPPQLIESLDGCKLGQDNLNVTGQDFAMQDISGKALNRRLEETEIKEVIRKECKAI